MSNGPWWGILFSAGTSSVVVVIINAFIQRSKLGAETDKIGTEATEIITKAAGGVVRDLESANKRLSEELAVERSSRITLTARVNRLETREILRERQWTTWADHVTEVLANAGATMDLAQPAPMEPLDPPQG